MKQVNDNWVIVKCSEFFSSSQAKMSTTSSSSSSLSGGLPLQKSTSYSSRRQWSMETAIADHRDLQVICMSVIFSFVSVWLFVLLLVCNLSGSNTTCHSLRQLLDCPITCLSIRFFHHLIICPSDDLSIWLTVHLIDCPSDYLSFWLSFHLIICPSDWLTIKTSACLSIYFSTICLLVWSTDW